jgi:hypothetical protein
MDRVSVGNANPDRADEFLEPMKALVAQALASLAQPSASNCTTLQDNHRHNPLKPSSMTLHLPLPTLTSPAAGGNRPFCCPTTQQP